MRKKKLLAITLSIAMLASSLTGCGSNNSNSGTTSEKPAATTDASKGDGSGDQSSSTGEVKHFTAFFATAGTELNSDNVAKKAIADLIGADCDEKWLTGQTAQEAVGTIISSGEYPDFIDGMQGTQTLIDNGALVPLDEHWDNYPNIKKFLTDKEWEQVKQSDGHIYVIPQFGIINGKETETIHNDEAFWIQTRVLKWAGYPEVKTMDQYFDLLEKYAKANPKHTDGTPVIPYTILCDDWRYFCLENAPQFLDGYPNDGSVIVNSDHQIVDYNTTPTAKAYFKKLNEEFNKNIVDKDSFTQTYDQYISKLSTGRVLGMIDQHWDFQQAEDSIKSLGYMDCTYVPLPITIDGTKESNWHTGGTQVNVSSGLAITTQCKDLEGALKFVDDLLSEKVLNIRNWGIEGTDYSVDENGLFTRTKEQHLETAKADYKASNLCPYSYFPIYEGMSLDGKNTARPLDQPSIFLDIIIPQEVKECFQAYGKTDYVDMIGSGDIPGPWFPMYSYSNSMTTKTPGGEAWVKMGELKHAELPKVCMAKDFDKAWADYMDKYKAVKPENFLSEMQTELDRRIKVDEDYNASHK